MYDMELELDDVMIALGTEKLTLAPPVTTNVLPHTLPYTINKFIIHQSCYKFICYKMLVLLCNIWVTNGYTYTQIFCVTIVISYNVMKTYKTMYKLKQPFNEKRMAWMLSKVCSQIQLHVLVCLLDH